jgi:hypothetical protein
MFGFGQTPTFQSDEPFNFDVSEDKRALTMTFSELGVYVGDSQSPAPTSTHTFFLVLPLEGYDESAEIEFAVSAFVLTTEGATATLLFSVNGQTTVADFPENSEQSFTPSLKITGPSPSECRLCVFLLVGRDSKDPNPAASLNVLAIDANIPERSPGKY